MTIIVVVVGAAIGAPVRYLLDRAVQARHESVFPWGTLAVNVIGSFVLGVLAGANTTGVVSHLVGTGFCGALTTYSTFGYETVRLAQEGASRLAVLNALASIAAGLTAAYVGIWFARAVL
ncbi:MAG TPA: fluoride efflux transporter CrcB [Candidatus Limnocylindrales bacterium]|nr:fluoride efflux transporter CrcB [Candidatus Limnocylindrales bacterium]